MHKLLYIEDNAVNALIVSELMARRMNVEFRVAVDGLSGLAQCRSWRPNLILLDMQLPDIDGFEVMRRLQADAELCATPVIALSANAMPKDIERALASGIQAYWTKPLDFARFNSGMDGFFGAP